MGGSLKINIIMKTKLNEFKGTKGKWIGKEDEGVFLEDGTNVFETGCGCCTSSHLNKYDALLISNAPEMLELLQELENDDETIPTWIWVRIQKVLKETLI